MSSFLIEITIYLTTSSPQSADEWCNANIIDNVIVLKKRSDYTHYWYQRSEIRDVCNWRLEFIRHFHDRVIITDGTIFTLGRVAMFTCLCLTILFIGYWCLDICEPLSVGKFFAQNVGDPLPLWKCLLNSWLKIQDSFKIWILNNRKNSQSRTCRNSIKEVQPYTHRQDEANLATLIIPSSQYLSQCPYWGFKTKGRA